MTCTNIPPLLSLFLDGELPREGALDVKAHLAQCAECRTLFEHWKQQGASLRGYLGRHAPGEDFVRRVLDKQPTLQPRAEPLGQRRAGRGALVRWLPAAAAILLASVILNYLFPNRESIGYARVIDPGDLEVLQSSAWVPTAAGEILRPGDWLRNPVPGTAELLWRNATRLMVEAGTLAHIPDRLQQPGEQVILLGGELRSEIQAGGGEFQVRTPAGSVTGTAGGFSIRAGFALLPRMASADPNTVLTGSVVPFSEIEISAGRVKLLTAGGARELEKGARVSFCETTIVAAKAESAPIQASLRLVPDAATPEELSSFLASTPEGLRLRLAASNVSLSKLLEWATGAEVSAQGAILVSGVLDFPINASPEALARAVGKALDLTISCRQEVVRRSVADFRPNQTPVLDWSQGKFAIRNSAAGLMTFELRNVPAGQAFRILRPVIKDLPEISASAEWVPITLQASDLSPADAAAHIASALDLQIETADCRVVVITIASSGLMSPGDGRAGQDPASPAQPGARPGSGYPVIPRDGEPASSTAAPAPLRVAADGVTLTPASTISPSMIWPVWQVLRGGNGVDGYPNPTVSGRSKVDGKVTRKEREYLGLGDLMPLPSPSTHMIWPALGPDDHLGGKAYWVRNFVGLPARTIWDGYDRDGRLLAQVAVYVEASSDGTLLPASDLPGYLGEGGHWETLSDVPLVGSRVDKSGLEMALGSPIASERLPRQYSVPGLWLARLGGQVWLVNPGEDEATVVVALMRNGSAIYTTRLTLAPHGGTVWPDWSSGMGSEFAGSDSLTTLVIRAIRGTVAAGPAK